MEAFTCIKHLVYYQPCPGLDGWMDGWMEAERNINNIGLAVVQCYLLGFFNRTFGMGMEE